MRYGPHRYVSGITVFVVALAYVGVAFTFSVHAQHRTTTSTTPVSVEQAPITADATLETAIVRARVVNLRRMGRHASQMNGRLETPSGVLDRTRLGLTSFTNATSTAIA